MLRFTRVWLFVSISPPSFFVLPPTPTRLFCFYWVVSTATAVLQRLPDWCSKLLTRENKSTVLISFWLQNQIFLLISLTWAYYAHELHIFILGLKPLLTTFSHLLNDVRIPYFFDLTNINKHNPRILNPAQSGFPTTSSDDTQIPTFLCLQQQWYQIGLQPWKWSFFTKLVILLSFLSFWASLSFPCFHSLPSSEIHRCSF